MCIYLNEMANHYSTVSLEELLLHKLSKENWELNPNFKFTYMYKKCVIVKTKNIDMRGTLQKTF